MTDRTNGEEPQRREVKPIPPPVLKELEQGLTNLAESVPGTPTLPPGPPGPPGSSGPPSPNPYATDEFKDLFEAWKEAEGVAKHFNDLVLNVRIKALGAIAVSAALFGNLLLSKERTAHIAANLYVMALAMLVLLMFWVGIWAIDYWYYQRLLVGAVAEAKRLDSYSSNRLQLSMKIDEAAKNIPKLKGSHHWPAVTHSSAFPPWS